MKVLLATDGSSYSDMAIKTLEALQLPSETRVSVMTVIPEHTFLGGITLDMLRGTVPAKKKAQQQKANKLLSSPVKMISASGLDVESLVRWGNPAEEIMKVADESGASLILMGAKGLTDSPVFRLGSVAQTVVKYARTSVLIVRKKSAKIDRALLAEKKTPVINRVVFAADGSKYSDRVTRFLLDLPLPQQTQVIVVIALQSYAASLVKMPTLDLRTNRHLLTELQKAEEGEARKIVARTSQQFQKKGYKTNYVVMQGGAGESILRAIKESNADIIALGSSGMTGVESVLMGSVADRIVRHAPYSVLVVRPPKA